MLIIFDCDGVLVNSETINIASEIEFLSKAGIHFDKTTYIQSFMGLSDADWRIELDKAVLKRGGKALLDEFYNSLHEFVLNRYQSELKAIEGLYEVLSDLKYKCCVASSTAPVSKLQWKLDHTGIARFFSSYVFSADMVGNGKPAPDLFLHASSAMEFEPKNCIVIEDSSNGVIAGKAAGMKVIGFTGGGHCLPGHSEVLKNHGADAVIDHFEELEGAVARFIELA